MGNLSAVLIVRDLWGVEIDGDAAELRIRLHVPVRGRLPNDHC